MFPSWLILAKLNCRLWNRHLLIFLATLTKTIVSTVREDKARRAETLEGPRTVGTGAKRAEAGVTVFPAKQGEFSSPTCI